MSPFDFVNSINYEKKDLFEDPQAEKDYSPFLTNRALSYFPDTIFYANEMNLKGHTPKQWQFDFLRYAVSKRKRFSKWNKKHLEDSISLIQNYYKYSEEKAIEVLSILTKEQLDKIKQQMEKGGRS